MEGKAFGGECEARRDDGLPASVKRAGRENGSRVPEICSQEL